MKKNAPLLTLPATRLSVKAGNAMMANGVSTVRPRMVVAAMFALWAASGIITVQSVLRLGKQSWV